MSTIDLNGNIHRGVGIGGGQFVGHARTAPMGTLEPDADDDLDLTVEAEIIRRRDEAARWGTAGVREGSRTPWGAADGVSDLGPGVVSVSTPSHGGVKLSPERNALIPPALRTSSGWYEEDCEVNIVVREFPELFQRSGRPEADVRAEADRSVRNWFPDKWEKVTGQKVLPGESTVRDEHLFLESTQDAFVSTSASYAESDRSFVVLTTERRADGARAEFLVPASEYEARDRRTRFIVDPARHAKLPPQATSAAENAPLTRFHTVPSVLQRQADRTLTPTARDRIAGDLSKRWQSGNGTVRSLHEFIEEEGITGRTAYVGGDGKRTYAMLQKNGNATYSLQVSKATFDYFTDVPDARSEAERAQQDAYVYAERIDRQAGGPTGQELHRAAQLQAAASRLREEEKAADVARNGTWEERDAARKCAQAARERAAVVDVLT